MINPGSLSEGLGLFIGFLLTLLVFSYLLGDNGLFRFAIHLFIGVSAGYVLAIAIIHVIWPKLIQPLLTGPFQSRILALVPVGLSLLLLARLSPRLAPLSTPILALMVGVGAATAVGGALLGTLLPQMSATINLFDAGAAPGNGSFLMTLFNSAVVLVGTVFSLAYFQFHARNPRPAWSRMVASVGQAFIALTLGVVFAGVYMAALTAMVERWTAIIQFIRWFFFPAA